MCFHQDSTKWSMHFLRCFHILICHCQFLLYLWNFANFLIIKHSLYAGMSNKLCFLQCFEEGPEGTEVLVSFGCCFKT